MTLETLTAFFGWLTILNLAVLALSTFAVLLFRDGLASLHAKLFDLDEGWIKQSYYTYLAGYKILTLVTAALPYLALKLI
ncbi:hypothetical protein RSK20926_03154 [Roseobacter sp. SK209-2-6]|uniref:DUF6868 family protein n=1 Tax=Roseobacter sp. SK209-2-6 TaxID=388739 RepID=UPI0000F3ED6F|nr:hypothetical protein [Roseobacter sp. SK209-2-6]EBA16769.1 hypothetical protein RSK20926_03154 [Roseobacter sp. SK209-2-6]